MAKPAPKKTSAPTKGRPKKTKQPTQRPPFQRVMVMGPSGKTRLVWREW